MITLKGKLKRVDSGMGKDDFGIFLAENVRKKYVNTGRHAGMMDSYGNMKPLYQWEYFLWRDVQVFKAQAYIVQPEHVLEVIGTLCMIGQNLPVRVPPATAFDALMQALGLTPLRVIVVGADANRQAVSWATRTASNVLPGGTIMALQTDKCWFVYPNNIRQVNRLLSLKEKFNV